MSDISQTSLRNVLRLAVRLSIYQYTRFYVKWEENVWVDILTRLSTVPITLLRVFRTPKLPSTGAEYFK